jgi:death-on-curing protein
MIESFGGEYSDESENLKSPGSLEYILAVIRGDFPYFFHSSIFEVAAFLCFRIIQGHIFFDGNKRTGFEAMNLLLQINNISLSFDTEVALDFSLKIAKKEISEKEFIVWLRDNSK